MAQSDSLLTLDLRQIVYVLSDALDYVGVDDLHHGKRVAFMAVTVAQALDLPRKDQDDLFDGGLLHDCGVSSTREHRDLVESLDWEGAEAHCARGEALLSRFEPLAHLASPIRYHHRHWSSLKEMESPPPTRDCLLANCLYMVDRVDAVMASLNTRDPVLAREDVQDIIRRNRGTRFAPRLVDGFLAASEREAFWFSLETEALLSYLDVMARHRRPLEITLEQLKGLATLFARIVDAKSPFTAEHSLGVSRVAHLLAERSGLTADRCDMVQIAALLHDIGKLRVPDDILEKPAALDRAERATITHHSFHTHQLLSRIDGFEEIAQWAAFHHEQLSGHGYPFHVGREALGLEARLVAVADVFQALAQDRPYRASLSPDEILRILNEMVEAGHLDSELVALVAGDLSEYWDAALRQWR